MYVGEYTSGEKATLDYAVDGVKLLFGSCLERMKEIPDASVDTIICDLPYGTTACKWDTIIPFEPLWAEYKRVIKSGRAILLFGSEPFSSYVRFSNIGWYKYDWYWDKKFGGNFVQAKRMPLKTVETISVFSEGKMPPYFPVMVDRDKPITQGGTKTSEAIPVKNNSSTHSKKVYDKKYPVTRLDFPKELGKTVHPTQKPVGLIEYLVKTYTEPGETILDNCMGSGTTGVACKLAGRKFIGIELDRSYFAVAMQRILTTT